MTQSPKDPLDDFPTQPHEPPTQVKEISDAAVAKMETEFAAAGKAGDFEALKVCLMAEHGAIDYAAMARAFINWLAEAIVEGDQAARELQEYRN